MSEINPYTRTKNIRRWTAAAIECYERGCVCEGCEYSTLSSNCQMKNAVLELVRKFGIPKKKNQGLKNNENNKTDRPDDKA